MLTPNPARGEVMVMLAGTRRRLCLTLGALARIEAVLGLTDWSSLPERLASLSAGDLVAILAALLDGGGESPEHAARATAPEAASALAAALAACA